MEIYNMKNKDSICGIYGWFDRESRECLYIGKSIDIEERKSTHLKNLKSGKHPRKEFVEYYNRLNNKNNLLFETLEVLETIDEKELSIAECKWFFTLNPKFYGKMPSPNDHEWFLKDDVKMSIRSSLNKHFEDISSKCEMKECNNKVHNSIYCKACKRKNEYHYSYRAYNISDKTIEKIISDYKTGISCEYISMSLNVNKTIVYMVLDYFNIKLKNDDIESKKF